MPHVFKKHVSRERRSKSQKTIGPGRAASTLLRAPAAAERSRQPSRCRAVEGIERDGVAGLASEATAQVATAPRSLVGAGLREGGSRRLLAGVKLHRNGDDQAWTPSPWVVNPYQENRHSRRPSMILALRAQRSSPRTRPFLRVEGLGAGPLLARPTTQRRSLSFHPGRQAARSVREPAGCFLIANKTRA